MAENERVTRTRAVGGVMYEDEKPHIDDVITLFHEFQSQIMAALTRNRSGSKNQATAVYDARDRLKVGLAELHLADLIDWTER